MSAADWDAVPVSQTQSGSSDWDAVPVKANAVPMPASISPAGSNWQNAFAGAGKAVVDAARGAKQISDIPAQWLEKKFPGLSDWAQAQGLPSAKDSASATNSDVAESRQLDAPLMDTKAGIAGNVAGSAATMLLPLGAASGVSNSIRGGKIAQSLLNPTTYKAAMASGAIQGALTPTLDDESRVQNMGVGAIAGAAGNLAVNTIGRVAQPVANVLTSARDKAVSVLQNAGIPLDAAQQTGSSFLGKLRSSFFDNPFTSGAQSDLVASQQAGYNRAVLGTIGENGSAATADVMDKASTRINGVFSDILNRNDIQMSDPVVSKIAAVQAAANEEEKAPVSSIANRLIKSVGEDGTVPGQTAYNIKKDLDRLSSSPDTTLAYHARQLRSTLMDAINDSLSTEDQAAFSQARNQFSNLKRIEPAIDRVGNGDISAPKLANVMAQKANRQASVYGRGDQQLVDLAQAGNMLLPDKNPNSGTASRLGMQAFQALAPALLGAGAGGAYSGDLEGTLAGAAGFAALPKAAQYLINGPASARYLSDGMQGSMTPLRSLLQLPQNSDLTGGFMRRLPIGSPASAALRPKAGSSE